MKFKTSAITGGTSDHRYTQANHRYESAPHYNGHPFLVHIASCACIHSSRVSFIQ